MAKILTIKQLEKLQEKAQKYLKKFIKYQEDLNDYIIGRKANTVPGGQPPPNPPGTH